MDEGYSTGANQGLGVPYFQVRDPIMQALSVEMVRGLASRHWRAGVDGIYLFNGPGTTTTYGYDKRQVLDEIGSPLRLQHLDKRFAVMRADGSFPNCFPQQRQLPTKLLNKATTFHLDVPDDLAAAGARVDHVYLQLLLEEACHRDELVVALNGTVVPCANETAAGERGPGHKSWAIFDVTGNLPRQGDNQIAVSVTREPRLAAEIPLGVSDIQLEVAYRYPNGPWKHPPGYAPRT
jgi:hypothetical protein